MTQDAEHAPIAGPDAQPSVAASLILFGILEPDNEGVLPIPRQEQVALFRHLNLLQNANPEDYLAREAHEIVGISLSVTAENQPYSAQSETILQQLFGSVRDGIGKVLHATRRHTP